MTDAILSKNRKIAYGILIVLVAAHALLSFYAPRAAATPGFELSESARLIIQISFVFFTVLSWFFAASAVIYARSLASQIKPEDKTNYFLRRLSWGVGILILGFVIATFTGHIRTYNPGNEFVRMSVTILNNYVYVFSSLIGLGFIYRAFRHQKKTGMFNYNIVAAVAITIVVSALWAGLIFTNPSRQTSTAPGLYPSFYINDLWIILTIVLPTVLAWFMGILAALNFSDFSVEAEGYEKQKMTSRLVSGIWLLVFNVMILFGILSAGSERLLSTGLVGVLVIVYFFIFMMIIANWRVAAALKKLYESR